MTRFTAPHWGNPSNRFTQTASAIGEVIWQFKLAGGVRAFVARNASGLVEWRVSGLNPLEEWHAVRGGTQLAANEARRHVLKLIGEIGAVSG